MRISPRLLQCALACWALCSAFAAQAVSVIPGVSGFGLDTPAGRGGTVYRVTRLQESGAGSLRACVDAEGPRVCVFEVSGTIRLSDELIIRNDYLTIAGQTAPSPGILLRGAGLRILASNVLVQHIRVRAGDDAAGPAFINRDSLKVEGNVENPVQNVVIDHCSFAWSTDEIASAWQHWDNVTFVNNIFAEPLHYSLHPEAGTPSNGDGHGYGVLFGPHDGRAALIGNLMAHEAARNPMSYASRVVVVNNVVYNRGNADIELLSEGGMRTFTSIVGNVFIRGPSYRLDHKPILVFARGDYALPAGSRLYVRDNVATDAGSDPWSLVELDGTQLTRAQLEASSAPAWPTGLVAMRTANRAVLDHVLAKAGARPMDRDSTDERIVASVRDHSGQIINCVDADGSSRCRKNAGGWPALAVRTRPLRLPVNQRALTSSGYTNLEIWLHALSADLQGDVATSPRPPSDIRVR
jgi:hypothetical protein